MEYLHPGMAIAEQLTAKIPGAKITFFGDGRPIERHTIHAAGHNYFALPSQDDMKGPLRAVRYMTDNSAGYCAARWMLREMKTDLVVALGGHASPLTFRAAQAARIPRILVEQNSVPNSLTRRLSKYASAVCLGFDEAAGHFPTQTMPLVTGIPSRSSLNRLSPIRRMKQEVPPLKCLVVFGGVGGASSINKSVPAALARLKHRLGNWRIVHQAGEGQLLDTERRYKELGLDALVVSYIDEIAAILGEADLAICRAGGSTLAELAQSATPALLVPDSRPGQEAQASNAQILERLGAVRWVDETDCELADALVDQLGPMLTNSSELAIRSETIATLARRDAAEQIANICCEAVGRGLPEITKPSINSVIGPLKQAA